MALSVDARFRRVADYAGDIGFPAAFPNFHEANYGKGVVGGVHFLRPLSVEWRDVRAADLRNPILWDIPELFRAANDYASVNGFFAGFPNCHQATYATTGQVFGINLIRPGAAEWRDVPRAQLGNPRVEDVPAMMRASADYAAQNGFAAGFPTFHQADHGTGVVYGQILFPASSSEWRDVYLGDLEPRELPTCVILAQFRNADGSLVPATRNRQFYQDYIFGRNQYSLADFFRISANYRAALVGSVYGWFDIGHTTAEHESLAGGNQRAAAFNWAIAAARANGVPVDNYPHKFVVVNRHTDFGGVGGLNNVVMPHAGNSDPFYMANFHSYMEHEFGHAIGIDHAFGPGGPYQDAYCIMSFATWRATHARTIGGIAAEAGCGLNVIYSGNLGGFPDHRRIDVEPTGSRQGFVIGAQGYPETDMPQAIRILPKDAAANTYWVSFRHPSRWDSGVGSASVLLHETRPGDPRSWFVPGPNAGALRNAGETIDTTDGRCRIELNAFSADGLSANISVYGVVPTGPTATGDDMQPGEVLNPGESISSPNGRYTLVYQADGNLVLYGPAGALWASNTGQPVGVAIMQGDGNLVLYGPGNAYVWDTATDNNPGSRLVVQDDGNVVIYRADGTAIWATNTVQ